MTGWACQPRSLRRNARPFGFPHTPTTNCHSERKNMKPNDWNILRRYGVTPDNLTVGGSLDLRNTAITALPDNLTVGGWLDLPGTAITALPDNLTVRGSLNLRGTAITALPDNLTVGGLLDLRDTAITALPDNLAVGGLLDLRNTAITALPDNLTVGGALCLIGSAITALHTDDRGYRLDYCGGFYHAGCRRFTADQARSHWGSPDYPNPERGAGFVRAIDAHQAEMNK